MTGYFEAIALAGYFVALAALLYGAIVAKDDTRIPLGFLATAMALMVFVSTSNTLEHLEITAALDHLEDYAEILFLPLVAYGLYGYLMASQGAQIDSARRVAASEHHMLLEIAENAPIGIAIVDAGGRIGYANPAARELLELQDDPSTLGFISPGKVWPMATDVEPEGILTVNPGEVLDGEPFVFRTPHGDVPLLLGATPLHPEPPHGASIVTIRRPAR